MRHPFRDRAVGLFLCGLSVNANALSEAEFCVSSGSVLYFEESLASQVKPLNEEVFSFKAIDLSIERIMKAIQPLWMSTGSTRETRQSFLLVVA
jgi:hypothetical protein